MSIAVVDASVVAELILNTSRGRTTSQDVTSYELIAPDHLTAEFLSILRGWSLGGYVSDLRADQALQDFLDLGVETIQMNQQLRQAWQLRHNVTAYDALYVALARAADCTLLTWDQKLIKSASDCARRPLDR